ncbi:DsbA family protein [uncultured Halopseudomonas sp.]|uniref:DsbA family protein n=1 Tax=uncultured Halopseudomonas sp. TaxID=2901193 RepID=UPI0030EC00B0|tara:strand:- start:9347 stop:9985 length:639 start_codon:yes stop_codon:yes gene_type:complete
MAQRLLYVMDPMCSWCWGFAPVIEQILARYPSLSIHLVAGGLRPGARSPLDDAARTALGEHWEAVAIASGQPFMTPDDLPAAFVYNTEPACRALVTARELDVDKAWALVRAIQHAFYARAEDVSQTLALIDLAEQVGYRRKAFGECFDAEITRAAIAADFSWTRDLGIAGFPTLLAERNGQLALLANGYQSPSDVLPLLERWVAAGEGAGLA